MKHVRRILSKLVIACVALFLVAPVYADETSTGSVDIGDYGAWNTDNNHEILMDNMSRDFADFAINTQMVDDYVPIEAKVGLSFMNAFSHVADFLNESLGRFIIAFIILAYLFWTTFESYMIITAKKPTQETLVEIVKRGGICALWVLVIIQNPAKIFMFAMEPILRVGTILSNSLLQQTVATAGVTLPNTCDAIHAYTAETIAPDNILDQTAAADIMCLPTQLSGFCQTGIATGWDWMWTSLGDSLFGFLCGLVFVGGFLYLGWKFAFMAFGVIADLFIALMLLPFTAVAESVGKVTFPGIAGNIYNGFIGLFKTESLQSQIMRFVNVALYFMVLSVIIGVCASLMTVAFNIVDGIPQMDDGNTWVMIISAALCWWLASNADKIAQEFGGAIDTSLGTSLQKDVTGLAKSSWGWAKGKWKAWRKK